MIGASRIKAIDEMMEEKLGGEKMVNENGARKKATWNKRGMTPESVAQKIKELEDQILAWELEVKYEDKLTAFREIYMEWYDGRLNLMELLAAMMDRSICKRITPFSRE